MKKQSDYYGYTDIVLKHLIDEVRDKYAPLKSILGIDEVNLLELKNRIEDEVYELIRKRLYVIGRYYYQLYYAGTTESFNFYDFFRGIKTTDSDLISLSEEWVDELLENVDPTYKVIFKNEFERKNSVLYEALLVSPTPETEVDAFVKRLILMLNSFGVRATDEAVLKAFADTGETEVRWNAENDEKTCTVCRKRDGKIYKIKELPSKPHYNCRCWFTTVR